MENKRKQIGRIKQNRIQVDKVVRGVESFESN